VIVRVNKITVHGFGLLNWQNAEEQAETKANQTIINYFGDALPVVTAGIGLDFAYVWSNKWF